MDNSKQKFEVEMLQNAIATLRSYISAADVKAIAGSPADEALITSLITDAQAATEALQRLERDVLDTKLILKHEQTCGLVAGEKYLAGKNSGSMVVFSHHCLTEHL